MQLKKGSIFSLKLLGESELNQEQKHGQKHKLTGERGSIQTGTGEQEDQDKKDGAADKHEGGGQTRSRWRQSGSSGKTGETKPGRKRRKSQTTA